MQMINVRDNGRYDFISPVPLPSSLFYDGGIFGNTNYHVFDISLFWLDLRENARRRLNSWLRKNNAAHPLIGAISTANARIGQAFVFQIPTENETNMFSADSLPLGLSLDTASGKISGTPIRNGVYPLRLTASNASGTDYAELALTIEARAD